MKSTCGPIQVLEKKERDHGTFLSEIVERFTRQFADIDRVLPSSSRLLSRFYDKREPDELRSAFLPRYCYKTGAMAITRMM